MMIEMLADNNFLNIDSISQGGKITSCANIRTIKEVKNNWEPS